MFFVSSLNPLQMGKPIVDVTPNPFSSSTSTTSTTSEPLHVSELSPPSATSSGHYDALASSPSSSPLLFRTDHRFANLTIASEVARCGICRQYLSLQGMFRFRGSVRQCVIHPNVYYCGLCSFSETECMLCFRRIESREELLEWTKTVNWGSYIPLRFDYFMCLLQEFGISAMLPPLWTVTLSTRLRTFRSQYQHLQSILGPLGALSCFSETDTWNVLRRIYSSYDCALDLGMLYSIAKEHSEKDHDLRYELFAQDFFHIALTVFDYNVKDGTFDAPYNISHPLLISFTPSTLERLESMEQWVDQ